MRKTESHDRTYGLFHCKTCCTSSDLHSPSTRLQSMLSMQCNLQTMPG